MASSRDRRKIHMACDTWEAGEMGRPRVCRNVEATARKEFPVFSRASCWHVVRFGGTSLSVTVTEIT